MAGSYDGSVRIDTKVDSKGFNKGISGMTAGLGKLAAAVGIAFGVAAIVNFGRSAVAAAAQMGNALTGLQSIMDGQGRSFSEAQAFIESYVADGLVPATNAITAYKNLALRGYDDSQIQAIMNALKDSAAFARTSSYTMGEAIMMASEGLKNENSILVDNAGVTRNVSMMWRDYAESIGTTVAALTLEQKRQAEVNGILNETRFQVGDAARLAGGYSGQVAALGTSFLNLKVALGNAIIPILTQIIPYIKMVIDWFTILFNTVARVINLFFGTSVSMADLEATSADVADNTEAAAGAAGGLADNTEDAAQAAKGALAAFDELNVLQMDEATDTGGGGGGGASPLGGGIDPFGGGDPIDLIPDEWAEDIANFKAALLDLLEPAIEAFGRLVDALTPLGETIWEGLKWAWENILVPLGEWVITEALPAFLDLLAGAVTVLNAVLVALQPLGIWFFETFLRPLAQWAGGAIIDFLEWLTQALYDFSDWIGDHQTLVETIVIVIGAFAAAIWLVNAAITAWTVISGLAAAATTLFGIAVAFLTSPIGLIVLAIAAVIAIVILLIRHWDEVKAVAGRVWAWIVAQWGILAAWFQTRVVEPLRAIFGPLFEFIGILAQNAWAVIQHVWQVVSYWFLTNVIEPIREFFREVWEDISEIFISAWETVSEFWGGAFDWFSEHVLDPISGGFQAVFSGIVEFVRGAVNGIIGAMNTLISGIVAGINTIIDAANVAGAVVPGWVDIPNVNAPQIPTLATGAVIPPNAEFLAMLGDQRSGRNIEAPESLIRQIIQEEMGVQETEVKISFEGTLGALVRELQPHITREQRRTGRSLVGGMA